MLSMLLSLMLIVSVMQTASLFLTKKESENERVVKTNGLSGLFKRKPGGTTFGNVLRAAASKVTGVDLSNFAKLPTDGSSPSHEVSQNLKVLADRFKVGTKNFKSNLQDAVDNGGKGLFMTKEERDAKKDNKGIIKKLFPKDKKWYMMPGVWIIGGGVIFIYWKYFRKGRKKGLIKM